MALPCLGQMNEIAMLAINPPSAEFTSSLDRLSNLPVELKSRIVSTLPVEDRLLLRLTSRGFAILCAEAMFQDGIFNVKLQVDDMTRLEAVSGHPLISRGIKDLRFLVTDLEVDEGHTRSRQWESNLLNQILPRLPNLTSIKVASFDDSSDDSFDDFDLYPCDCMIPDEIPYSSRRVVVERYIKILLATQNTNRPIQRLILDPLPFECFTHDPEPGNGENKNEEESAGERATGRSTGEELQRVVEKVQDLRVTFINFEFQEDEGVAAQLVGQFLGGMQFLRNLDLTWDREVLDTPAFRDLWRASISKDTWPHLERLSLRCTEIPSSELLVFLLNHESTLRCLRLRDKAVVYTQRCTFEDLTTACTDQLYLDKFQCCDEESGVVSWGLPAKDIELDPPYSDHDEPVEDEDGTESDDAWW